MAGINWIELDAAEAGDAGGCASPVGAPPLAVVDFDVLDCFRSAGDGIPRRSSGRSESSSAAEAAGVADAAAAGVVAAVEVVEAVGAVDGVEAGADAAGGAVGAGSGNFGFSVLARFNTGGPSTASGGRFEGIAFFLAAAAASALADCQVPSPIHVLFAGRALETVNNPWETPVRTASYTVPLSSAIGTGAALYALAS